jgi:hypothetical protein
VSRVFRSVQRFTDDDPYSNISAGLDPYDLGSTDSKKCESFDSRTPTVQREANHQIRLSSSIRHGNDFEDHKREQGEISLVKSDDGGCSGQ